MEKIKSFRVIGAAAAMLVGSALTPQNTYAFGRSVPADPNPVPSASPTSGPLPIPFPTQAPAAGDVRLGLITAAGTGCPAGAIDVAIDADGAFLIRLDQLAVQLAAGQSLDRKACALAIPIEAAPGLQIVLSDIQALGDYDLALGDRAQASLEAFTAGSSGAKISDELGVAARAGRIAIGQADAAATACGAAAVLRTNLSLLVQRSATISSAASAAAITQLRLKLQARACQ